MSELKKELSEFHNLLMEVRNIGEKLLKYKGNLNYRKSFNSKIRSLDKKYLLIEKELSQQSNKKLVLLFKKIKGDLETITEYKNPETTIEEIDFIEDKIWNKIEVELYSEEDFLEERIYEGGSPFDFHNDTLRRIHDNLFYFSDPTNKDIWKKQDVNITISS